MKCPRCSHMYVPILGYKEFSIEEALTSVEASKPSDRENKTRPLPQQMGSAVNHTEATYVTYMSPAFMRLSLEKQVTEHGEGFLERDALKQLDPQLYYNLWWYSARKILFKRQQFCSDSLTTSFCCPKAFPCRCLSQYPTQ